MDAGLTIRPIANVAAADVVRAAPAATAEAVRTQLTASQSVTAAAASEAPRNDPQKLTGDPELAREVLIDPAAREVIYRVVDVGTGRIVRQVPEEALLRLRAYARALARGKGFADVLNRADLQT